MNMQRTTYATIAKQAFWLIVLAGALNVLGRVLA